MAIRETLEQNPKLTIAAVAAVIVVAVFAGVRSLSPDPIIASDAPVFFTDDNGQTWYKQPGDQIAPYDHNGKTAVRCYVYSSKSGKLFAGFLQKLPDTALEKLKELPPGEKPSMIKMGGSAVIKRPADTEWVSPGSLKGHDIMNNITGPDGSYESTPVLP